MTDVLVTNGGPHPADKWAAATADRIVSLIQVDEQSSSEAASAARKAKPRLAIAISDAIEAAFQQAMLDELDRVNNGVTLSRSAPFQIETPVSDAVAAVVGAATGTPFADHFSLPPVQAVVRNIVTQNILDAANVQRSWSFDAKGL